MEQLATVDDLAIQILSNEGAQCGNCGDQPGDRTCPACEICRRRYVNALRAAGWAPRSEVQERLEQAHTELAAIRKDLTGLETVMAARRR
ncbi:hypothetical protein [Streptomyces kaempferi]|uniref:Uncharacterized protein n=1 Tax=Streptomyces kaempferi TaxID=333725 RepID=A0ABW3XKJ6_9ACTN